MNKPQLVILAAGMGNRYGGLKQIDPVGPGGEVLLEYALYDAIEHGFERVVFVIRKTFEDKFREHVVRQLPGQIETACVYQELNSHIPDGTSLPDHREKPLGTGHALLCTRDQIDAPFAVINADDYYGPKAFKLLHTHLRNTKQESDPPAFCMIGYPLKHTLSEYGTVSRGLCRINEHEQLIEIEEQESIRSSNGSVVYRSNEGKWQEIDPDTTVSLNCWGFTPQLFPHLERSFSRFLNKHADDATEEFYLTTVVNRLLQQDRAEVSVYPSDEQWFGVTYGEDQQEAREEIRKRIRQNRYPRKLWKE